MPKLIVKQDTGPQPWTRKYAKWLSLGGLGILLLLVGLAAFMSLGLLGKTPAQSGLLAYPSLDAASNPEAKEVFQRQYLELGVKEEKYQQLSVQKPEDYNQAVALMDQADGILQHLYMMEEAALSMGLPDDDLQQLETHQQYLQDLWQSKLHFSELRMGRLQAEKLNADPAASMAVSAVAPAALSATTSGTNALAPAESGGAKEGKGGFLAEPLPGMKLPEGVCSLTGPDACKPE